MSNRKGKLPPLKKPNLVMRFVVADKATGIAVIATETPVERYDESRGCVVREVLLMEGCRFRGGRNQIPIVDSHDDSTVRNILGSIQGLQINRSTGELFGNPSFASDPDSQVIATRFNEGHITDFSITADPIKGVFIQRGQTYTTSRGEVIEGPAEIVTEWEPHNASICATGADVNSSVRRSYTDLKRKVIRMDEASLAPLREMGLPDGMTDPSQVLAWVVGKMGSAAPAISSEPIENAVEPPVPPPADPVKEEEKPMVENTADTTAEVKRALAEYKKNDLIRRTAIKNDCKLMKLDAVFADELCDSDVTVEVAREKIIRKASTSESGSSVEGTDFRVTQSSDDKFLDAARDGLIMRSMKFSGLKNTKAFADGTKPAPGAEDFQNAKLFRIAQESLVRRGINVNRMTEKDIALVAMGHEPTIQRCRIQRDGNAYHTTGSFANLMLDAANKTLRAGYEEQEITGTIWARQGTSATDLKDMHRIMYSEFPNLEMVPETHDYPDKAMSDQKEKYKVEKFGAMFSVSWETIVNDDLDAISKTPVYQGKAAKRTLNAQIYQVLTANATMSDSVALFGAHASGTNIETSGGAPNVARFSAGFLSMASQKGVNSTVALNITPKYVIAPWALSAGILEILGSIARPEVGGSAAGNSNTHNLYGPMGQRTLLPVFDFCLDSASAAAWYMASDSVDTVEYTFLEGEETPVIETEWNFNNDTLKHKIRQTMAAKAIDWRGLYQNDGS